MWRLTLLVVAIVALGVSFGAPMESAEAEADPSVDFPQDEVEAGRGWTLTNTVGDDSITEGGLITKHWGFFSRMLSECGARGLEACVGSKALAFVDGYLHQDSIPLTEGVALIKRNLTDEETPSERAEGSGAPEAGGSLAQQLLDRFSKFLRTFAVQLRLPETDKEEVAIGLDEGRKLKKFLLPIILGIGVKVLGVIPLVFGGLALLVGKAVFISKLAFVVAALVGLSSLMSGFRGSGGDATAQKVRIPLLSQVFAPAQPAATQYSYTPQATQYSASGVSWPAASNSYAPSSSSNSGGWSRRSTDESQDAQELAYAAQIPHDYYQ
ncbi:uncharacterized protein [Hetaerina americana]|uniref:uncharacterized protein n=1 Tax=Hetaerina americana TaxID=62018 RepID=UPI003A7F61CE